MGIRSSKTIRSKSADEIDVLRLRVLEARRRFLDLQLKDITNQGDASDGSDEETQDNSSVPESQSKQKTARPPLTRITSALDGVDCAAQSVDPKDYDFPFENIVLEGGGNKGLAYCGAVGVLEELGVWKNVRRLAGTSAGAMTAALLAVGCNSEDIEEYLSQDLSRIFLDHRCGYLSLLPNLLRGYGWNPGKKIFQWFGHQLKERTGDEDVTFEQIYKKFDKELCVVVTNLSLMMEEYCHPKTTPDMPVRLAVRMSMAIPGMFCATTWERYDQKDTFVDGGVLCNYPIHCFDGWWLSMKPNDSFLKRLQPIDQLTLLYSKKERFGTFNERTLGFLLYADNETDLHRYQLEKRIGVQIKEFPNTKLAKKKKEDRKKQEGAERVHKRVVRAVDVFIKVLNEKNGDENWSSISHDELLSALNDMEKFPPKLKKTLFGDLDDESIIQYLDRDGNGQITYQELARFMEEAGIHMQTRFLGYERREIKSLFTFLDTLQSTVLINVKRVFVEEKDLDRTVGINTGHVGTSDFKLEKKDREFVIQQGRQATLTFLKYYVAMKGLAPHALSSPPLAPQPSPPHAPQPSPSHAPQPCDGGHTTSTDAGEKDPLLSTDHGLLLDRPH